MIKAVRKVSRAIAWNLHPQAIYQTLSPWCFAMWMYLDRDWCWITTRSLEWTVIQHGKCPHEKELQGHRDRKKQKKLAPTSHERGLKHLFLTTLRRRRPTAFTWQVCFQKVESFSISPALPRSDKAIEIHFLHNWRVTGNNFESFILLFSREKHVSKIFFLNYHCWAPCEPSHEVSGDTSLWSWVAGVTDL